MTFLPREALYHILEAIVPDHLRVGRRGREGHLVLALLARSLALAQPHRAALLAPKCPQWARRVLMALP
eukprot:5707227-Pyramimonas_sp.AAC.1